ncbi:hypothetical protein NQ315_014975 [Exocentrus adspersus]|uniref:Uncharacterized protein n=1 Tax=Exocentrus adspersus TaxID=1586481 RepID=A0AAV8VYI4_9CUCU|nr:hypothetical protein NQ315_014975 [Exocentrus adspersus]
MKKYHNEKNLITVNGMGNLKKNEQNIPDMQGGGTWRLGRPTCVLESDFGFILNCAFKKSGLFRIRNLGGVKAHIGLETCIPST